MRRDKATADRFGNHLSETIFSPASSAPIPRFSQTDQFFAVSLSLSFLAKLSKERHAARSNGSNVNCNDLNVNYVRRDASRTLSGTPSVN